MNKKLIFRILGAISSALIIVSVFVPFVSVTGYTQSLWESYKTIDSIYLPIMILIFGGIGVIFFALNIKTEFAYMSAGATLFFVIMQTIEFVSQESFNVLSIGYYFLVIGSILTGLMAFLSNLKTKEKVVVNIEHPVDQRSMLDQIDRLYNEPSNDAVAPVQPINNLVQPLPIQPLGSINTQNPIPVVEQPTNIDVAPQPEPINVEQSAPVQNDNMQPIAEPQLAMVNPVVNEFSAPVNPVVSEFTTEAQTPTETIIQETPIMVQPTLPVQPIAPVQDDNIQPIVESQPTEPAMINPVVNEFTNPSGNTQNNQGSLDIFGQ